MIPQLSILVPLYKQMVAMKGINHFWGVIIVSATFNLPMAIYMYSNFISAIPKELDEAAMIDGCSRLSVFYRIILPSLKPVTASVIIWTSVGIWNDYQFQLYFLQKPKLQTITLAITKFFYGQPNRHGRCCSCCHYCCSSSSTYVHSSAKTICSGCHGQRREIAYSFIFKGGTLP